MSRTTRTSPLLPIFLTVLIDVLGLTIVLPLLPFYAQKYGASPFLVGLLVTSYAFFQLLSGPILGKLSDKQGRKRWLMISQIGTFAGFILMANAPSLFWIFVARIIDGATAGNLSLAQAYISDVTTPEKRTRAFGLIGIAFGVGFFLGPMISGTLAHYSYSAPIYLAAGLSFLSIMASYFFLPAEEEMKKIKAKLNPDLTPENEKEAHYSRKLGFFEWKGYARFFRNPLLKGRLTQFFLFTFGFSLFMSGFAMFAERKLMYNGLPFGPTQVGWLYAYSGFLGALLQGGLVGRLATKHGEEKLAIAGFSFSFLGYFILGANQLFAVVLLTTSLCAIGNSILRPVLMTLITKETNPREQGLAMGLTQSLNSVSQIIAPLISGLLIQYQLLVSWAWMTGSVFLGGLIFSLLLKKSAKHLREQSALA